MRFLRVDTLWTSTCKLGACKHEAIFLLLVPSRLPCKFEVSLHGFFFFGFFFYDRGRKFAVVKTFLAVIGFVVLAIAPKYKLAA